MTKHREQIVAAAHGKVPEQILGAVGAKPRGAMMSSTTGVAGALGQKWSGKQQQGAANAGIRLGSPGAVAVTPANLVTMAVKVNPMGQIKEITEVLSVVPLAHVDSVKVSRFGFAGVMEISLGGNVFKLEGHVSDMREFADAFALAKSGTS